MTELEQNTKGIHFELLPFKEQCSIVEELLQNYSIKIGPAPSEVTPVKIDISFITRALWDNTHTGYVPNDNEYREIVQNFIIKIPYFYIDATNMDSIEHQQLKGFIV